MLDFIFDLAYYKNFTAFNNFNTANIVTKVFINPIKTKINPET